MNPFENAMKDLFGMQEFLEDCTINGETYKCFSTPQDNEVLYTDAGLVDDAPFVLQLKLPLHTMPKIGDKVKYDGENYKVASITHDRLAKFIKLHLVTTSKGV